MTTTTAVTTPPRTELPTLSYSALTAHRKCPQAWHYGYERKLEPYLDSEIPVEREFGSWWHALRAAETIQRGRSFGSLRHVPKTIRTVDNGPTFPGAEVMPSDVLDAAEVWWRTLSEPVREVWVERLGGQDLTTRLDALFGRWLERWEEERRYEQPLARELYWRRQLPGTEVELVGFVDEVYLDTRRNMVVVRDDKSSRALAAQTAADDMMDSQLQLYAWGATPVVKAWDLGGIRAVAYDRARLVAPKEPQITLAGTLSKSVTDYDVHTYIQWAWGADGKGVPYPGRKKDGSDAGLYVLDEKVVEKLSDPAARSAWFQRTVRPVNVNTIRTHLRSAIDSAADIARTVDRTAATGEAARNLTRNCRFCDFVKLCQVEMVGGPGGEYPLVDYGLRVRPGRAR